MKTVFADTSFYIALLNHRDEHHRRACQFANEHAGDFVTSAWIITELADYLCNTSNRSLFLEMYEDLCKDARVTLFRSRPLCSIKGSSCMRHAPTRTGLSPTASPFR